MKVKLLSGLSLMAILLTGCFTVTSGNVSVSNGKESDASIKKVVNIGEFNEVETSQSIKVIFSQGSNSGKASISTTPSAEKYLRVGVTGNKLRVYYDVPESDKSVQIKGPSIVTVSSPSLTNVTASSGAEFKINGNFNGKDGVSVNLSSGAEFEAYGNFSVSGELNLNMSSAASFDGSNLACGNLSLDISSGADFDVKNLSGDLKVNASSGSDVDIDAIKAKSITLGASSGSDIEIENISADEIKANASSGADISLKGKTKQLQQSASSGGSVKTKNLTVK